MSRSSSKYPNIGTLNLTENTIVDSADEYVYLVEDFADPAGDSGMVDIVGLTKTLDAESVYRIECELYIVENGATGTQFHLETDSNPAFGNLTYEIVGGVAATLQAATHGYDFGSENWSAVFIPGDVTPGYPARYTVKITGMILTNAVPIVLQAMLGNYTGLGDSIVNPGSFLKITKLP